MSPVEFGGERVIPHNPGAPLSTLAICLAMGVFAGGFAWFSNNDSSRDTEMTRLKHLQGTSGLVATCEKAYSLRDGYISWEDTIFSDKYGTRQGARLYVADKCSKYPCESFQ